jgi:hypothetical protein
VKGCGNRRTEGNFIGDLCAPCHDYLVAGEIGVTCSFLGDMRDAVPQAYARGFAQGKLVGEELAILELQFRQRGMTAPLRRLL